MNRVSDLGPLHELFFLRKVLLPRATDPPAQYYAAADCLSDCAVMYIFVYRWRCIQTYCVKIMQNRFNSYIMCNVYHLYCSDRISIIVILYSYF